ncbi:hypothetical protein LTS18_014975 [Coniosporium uncinatum]|uniref:Uncharacterized protein n=1 Tax=Coniosporium uncinatum TaxID=93489 RepID=A0ACC3DV06_9PEZI|nr:hypothetical protein LTS18_014975 [Coniosporium uncinatum]
MPPDPKSPRRNTMTRRLFPDVALLYLLDAVPTISAVPLPNPKINLNDLFGPNDITRTWPEEIKCYNFPYGGIGFLTHLIAFWMVIWLGLGMTPIWPIKELTNRWAIAVVGLLSFFGAVPIVLLNILQCRARWQFVCLGVWKLTTSFILVGIVFRQAFRPSKRAIGFAMFFWLGVYGMGTVVGMTGLMDLVRRTWHGDNGVKVVTLVFSLLAFSPVVLGILFLAVSPPISWCQRAYRRYEMKKEMSSDQEPKPVKRTAMQTATMIFGWTVVYSVFCFGVLATLYSDWVLAAVARNWSGRPDEDQQAIFWSWTILKALPVAAF